MGKFKERRSKDPENKITNGGKSQTHIHIKKKI